MTLKTGWHPQDDGRERYWDGERWTDAFRDAPEPAPVAEPPPEQAKPDPQPIGRVSRCGSGDEGPDEYDTQATCKELVRGVLKNPSTADFMDEEQDAAGASGTVVAENALGGKVTSSYRCVLDGSSIVRLVQAPQ